MLDHEVFVRYVEDNHSFGQYLLSDDVAETSAEAARHLVGIAKGFSPRSSGDGPHYQDSFEVREEVVVVKDGRFNNPRRAAVVVNTSDHAAQVEFGDGQREKERPQGGSHGEPARPMARAASAFPGGVYRELGGR